MAYRLVGPRTIAGIAKQDGRVCVTATAVLADDGGTVHVTYRSGDGLGNAMTSHGVFVRVEPACASPRHARPTVPRSHPEPCRRPR